jgi:heme A synthase
MRAHSLALGTVAATFVLLVLGGLVHATGSSLACPDWPLCNGELVAPMSGGALYHQLHRFAAVAVGALVLGLAVVVWTGRRPAGARALAAAAVALVAGQAALGAIAVRALVPLPVAAAHLAASVSLFALLIALADRLRPARPPRTRAPRGLVAAAAATAFGAILLGGLVRHGGAAMACGGDSILCRDALWPAGSGAAQLHAAHRLVAAALGLLTLAAVARPALRGLRERDAVRTALALAALALVLAQVALGQLTLLSGLSPAVATAHSALGALLLGALVALYLALDGAPAPRSQSLHRRLAPTP